MRSKQTGYEIRPADMQDAAAVAAVCNAWELISGTDERTSADGVRKSWQRSGVEIETDTRVVEVANLRIVGYALFSDSFSDYARLRGMIRMHPDYTNSAAESDLLDWIDTRAAGSLRRIPGGPRVALSHLAMVQDTARRDLLLAHGYTLVHHAIRMRFDLERTSHAGTFRSPAGVSIRLCDPSTDLPAVSAVVQEAFREHWGFVERTTKDDVTRYERWLKDDPGIDMGVWHLACIANEIVGVCLGTSNYGGNRKQAYIFTLGVRDAWRGKGVGRALLLHSIEVFRARDCIAVDLDVDTANLTGALRLYESAGMQPRWQTDEYEKELRAAD